MKRRKLLSGMAASAAVLGMLPPARLSGRTVSDEYLSQARSLLDRVPAMDLHTHPGMFALKDIPDSVNPRKYHGDEKVARRIAGMKSGRLGCAFIATVSDAPILRPPRHPGETIEGREGRPGEAWREYQRQKSILDEMVDRHGLIKVTSTGGIRQAHRSGQIAVLYDCEGGDHLEGDPARLAELHADGVRVLQPIHVAYNGLGDVGNRPPVYQGLSDTGREVIREMNRLSMLIDMAHASEETTVQAAAISVHPLVVSHALPGRPGRSGGLHLSHRHAEAVIDTGGVIGAFPGSVNRAFTGFMENLLYLVDFAGVDHVGIGTDMDGNLDPVVDDYHTLPVIAAWLLEHGLNEDETGRIMGGNALRVTESVIG